MYSVIHLCTTNYYIIYFLQFQDELCLQLHCETPWEYIRVKQQLFKPFLDMVQQVDKEFLDNYPKVSLLWGSPYPINLVDYHKALFHRKNQGIHRCFNLANRKIGFQETLESNRYRQFTERCNTIMEQATYNYVALPRFIYTGKGRNKKDVVSYLTDGIHIHPDAVHKQLAPRIKRSVLSLLSRSKRTVEPS